ncbi:3-alpha domain-containing protein [Blautia pseudococcoides]
MVPKGNLLYGKTADEKGLRRRLSLPGLSASLRLGSRGLCGQRG